jgi:hypothetical protein
MHGNNTNSLYSYSYFKLAKMPCFLYNLLCFLFSKIGEKEDRTGSGRKGGRGKGAQIMYTR